MKKRSQLWVVSGCHHHPFVNKKMWDSYLRLLKYLGKEVYGVINDGDFGDENSLSTYDKGKFPLVEGLTRRVEMNACRKAMADQNAAITKGARKVFIYGNHEARYLKAIQYPDHFKMGLEPIEDHMRLHELGWEVHNDWQNDVVTLGDHLDVFHGIYYNQHSALQHLRKSHRSALYFHTHTIQVHHEGQLASFNCGFMGDRRSRVFGYADRFRRQSWREGFALVNIDDNGDYFVQQVQAHNSKFFVWGKEF